MKGYVIKAKKAIKCGERMLAPGDPIGAVRLADGVTLNYLVDALRFGSATEELDEDLAMGRPVDSSEADPGNDEVAGAEDLDLEPPGAMLPDEEPAKDEKPKAAKAAESKKGKAAGNSRS